MLNTALARCILNVCLHACVCPSFQVHARWVLDTDVFNEWMNEEDYHVNERQAPIIFRQRLHLRGEQVGLRLFRIFSEPA